MASPFTVFRKNQKVLLAITGILAMIAFVFLGTCIQAPHGAQARENPVVVSWKFGDITEAEMAGQLNMRRILNHFLRGAMSASGKPVNEALQFFAETEDAVVRSMVLARRGRELGLVISDDMVNREIAQLTNNSVSSATLERIVANFRMGSGQRLTPKQIFDALREEMLARHVAMLFLDGLGAEGQSLVPALDTPAQRWDHFQRLEKQMRAQVLPLPVDQFTGEVGKPSDEELKELFEKHKGDLPSPQSPDPGFRLPYRARFEYFKADMDEMVTAEMEKVTDDEVREYYEKNKDTQFRKAKLSKLDEGAGSTEQKDGQPTADQPPAQTGSDKKSAEKPAEAKAIDTQSSDAKTGDDKAGDTKTANPKSSNDAKEEPAKKEPAAKPKGANSPVGDTQPKESSKDAKGPDKSSAIIRHSPFRFVSFQDEKNAATDSAKQDVPPGEKSKATTSAAEPKSPSPPESKETDAKAATNDSKSENTAAKDGKENVEEAAKSSKAEPAKPEPVEYRPLEQVRDEIRRAIAREHLQKQIDERFTELRSELVKYADQRMRWQRQVAKNPDEPKPAPLDLPALAKKYGLKSFTTELISRIQAANSPDMDIAKSIDFTVRTQANPFGADWTAVAFEKGNLYKPRTSEALGGDRFLWWKVEEKEGQVPEFNEVRDQVLEAWKRIEARGIAKRKAEQYAKTIRQARQPMKDVLAQEKELLVKEVGPFSWLTRLNVPLNMMQQAPPVHYPEVEGVQNPGEEFMETAFHLAPNEVGVAFNHPKSIVYVIQPMSYEPSQTVLEQEFMAQMKNYDRYRAAGLAVTSQAQNDWMQSLFAEYNVEWHRPADVHNESRM